MSFKYYLADRSFEDLIPLWNEWCEHYGQSDMIYESIEEFAELYGEGGLELARKVFFGDVKNWNDRVYLDVYGNLVSCWSVESSPIDIDALADFMKENDHQDYVAWCDEQPSFAEWLDESYEREDLITMWEEYTDEDAEDFDLSTLAESIEEIQGDEYLAYMKEVLE